DGIRDRNVTGVQTCALPICVNVLRSTIPAVTHVDYSARVQTVDAERNPRFYRLLRAFQARTGCPVLVNTSFNIRGEPIVCTPAEIGRASWRERGYGRRGAVS